MSRHRPYLRTILALLTVGVCGIASMAQAEEVLRVSRRGVIYYYFNDRPGAGVAASRPARAGPVKVRPRPAGRKLAAGELQPVIQQASAQHNLPPALIKALIRVESNFNPAATSPKGAQGLMQLMPGTASDLEVQNPYDVRENVWGGTRYLHQLLQRFNNRLPLALAAYNAGPGRVDRTGDVPKICETQNFVRQVCAEFLKYRAEETAGQPPCP